MSILQIKTVRFLDVSLVTQPGTGRRGTWTRAVDNASRAFANQYCLHSTLCEGLESSGCGRAGLRGPERVVSLECQGQKLIIMS